MAEPTLGERELGEQLGLTAESIAAAREVLNTIAALPWPEPERIAILTRFARTEKADVGQILGKKALDLAPLFSFDHLIPVLGLAEKRVAGLARALCKVDTKTFADDTRLLEAWKRIADLEASEAALRDEFDRAFVDGPGLSPDSASADADAMRIADVAASIGTQLQAAELALRDQNSGLRLHGVDLALRGEATNKDGDVAMEFRAGSGGSGHLNLSFVPAGQPQTAEEEVDVPEVIGYTPSLARRKLVQAGFAVSFASGGAGETVVRQDPPAGETVRTGTLVRLLLG